MSMQIPKIEWPQNAADAIAVQNELRALVKLENDFDLIDLIAGIDCSYDMQNNLSRAIIVTMRRGDLMPLEIVQGQIPTDFPYIPGLLSFREIPVILAALKQLRATPDLLMVDGQGIAHPRRMGIAAHLGALLDMPAIGVAKSRLTGKYKEPAPEKFSREILFDKKEQIGTVLRSKDNVRPLFVSPGHKIDHETSVRIVCDCLRRHRLPEPTRIADKISKMKPEELPPLPLR